MIRLYQGSGSTEIELVGVPKPREDWADLRRNACRLLRARGVNHAAELLETIPFDLCDGTNFFEDEFSLLYLKAPLDQYVELAEQSEDPTARLVYQRIAETITEIGAYIRFITVALDTKSQPKVVSNPTLAITSDSVEMALADCEHLIHSRGATSGVDRIHTAFHGYLHAVCVKYKIEAPTNSSVTQLFKLIRTHHPNFVEAGPRAGDIDRIVHAMATIVDSLNPLRNQATLAHPNDAVLQEKEAMLVINSVRTLLHYFNEKLR